LCGGDERAVWEQDSDLLCSGRRQLCSGAPNTELNLNGERKMAESGRKWRKWRTLATRQGQELGIGNWGKMASCLGELENAQRLWARDRVIWKILMNFPSHSFRLDWAAKCCHRLSTLHTLHSTLYTLSLVVLALSAASRPIQFGAAAEQYFRPPRRLSGIVQARVWP